MNESLGFKVLFLALLKRRFRLDFKKETKRSVLRLVLFVLLFAALTGLLAMLGFACAEGGLFGESRQMPRAVWSLLFFWLVVAETMLGIHRTANILFFLPGRKAGSRRHVLLARHLVAFLEHLGYGLLLFLPALWSLGIVNGEPGLFYLWSFIAAIGLSCLTYALASLLSYVYFYFLAFLEALPALKGVFALALLVGITYLIYMVARSVPTDFDIPGAWQTLHLQDLINSCDAFLPKTFIFSFPGEFAIGYISSRADLPLFAWQNLVLLFVFLFAVPVCGAVGYFMDFLIYRRLDKEIVKPLPKFHMLKKSLIKRGKQCIKCVGVDNPDYEGMLRRYCENDPFPLSIKKTKAFLEATYPELTFEIVPYDGSPCLSVITRGGRKELCFIKTKGFIATLHSPTHRYLGGLTRSPFGALIIKDFNLGIKNPKVVTGIYFLIALPPFVALLLNLFFLSRTLTFIGKDITVFIDMMVILAVTMATSISATSLYSRQGEAIYRTLLSPVKPRVIFVAKLFPRAALMTASLILTGLVFARFNSVPDAPTLPLTLCFIFIGLGHLFLCAELDFRHPKIKGQRRFFNKQAILAIVFALLILLVFYGSYLFFVSKSPEAGFYSLLIASAIFFIARMALFLRRIDSYGVETFTQSRENK